MTLTQRKFGGKKMKNTIKYTWGIHSLTRKRMKTHTKKKKRSSKKKRSRKKRNTAKKNSKSRIRKGGDQLDYLHNAYKWEIRNNVNKGYVYNVDGENVYIKTQVGEDGPIQNLKMNHNLFNSLEKTLLGSDDTKNLKRKAIEQMQTQPETTNVFDSDYDNDSSDDDGTASLTPSEEARHQEEGARHAEMPMEGDDENENDNRRGNGPEGWEAAVAAARQWERNDAAEEGEAAAVEAGGGGGGFFRDISEIDDVSDEEY